MLLQMTALGPQDTVHAEGRMTPTEMGLLCALLGSNAIRAQTLFLAGLWLRAFSVSLLVQAQALSLCVCVRGGVQTVKLATLVQRN